MKRPPAMYLLLLGALLIVAIIATLTYLGVRPFDSLSFFIATSAASFFVLLIAGVVGGVFVGMLIAHRILGNREFSPFERTVLQSLEDVRERLDRLEARKPDEPRLRP